MRYMTDDTMLRPQVRPVAELTPDNLRRLLEDMDSGPGLYTSADLYRWYANMAGEADLAPVTRRKFGAVLRELGYKPRQARVNGKISRCWFITRRAFRGGASPEATPGPC